MTYRQFIFSVSLLLLLGGSAVAPTSAAPTIVSANAIVQPARISPGGKGVLRIIVHVATGFHINANKPNDPDLIPTVIKASGPACVTFGAVAYAKPSSIAVAYEKMPMLVYQGQSVIVVPFSIAKSTSAGNVALKANMSYQGCNAVSCYPPNSAAISAYAVVK